MNRRLLLDVVVVELLEAMPIRLRRTIWARLHEIGRTPGRFSDYFQPDEHGRDVAVHVFQSFAIVFWDDFADRHVKIMDIHPADSI